jgi:hypothetical protein
MSCSVNGLRINIKDSDQTIWLYSSQFIVTVDDTDVHGGEYGAVYCY